MTQPTRTNPTFKPGDLVTTRMRGPQMTVEIINVNDPTVIGCIWFDAKDRLHRDSFDDFALKPVVSLP